MNVCMYRQPCPYLFYTESQSNVIHAITFNVIPKLQVQVFLKNRMLQNFFRMVQKKLLITLCIVSCLAMRLKFSLLPMMLSPLFWALLTDLVHSETKVSLGAKLGEKELSKHGWFNPLCLPHFSGTWSWFHPNLSFQGLQVHSQGWGKKRQGGYLRSKSCLFILSKWLV